MEIMSDNPIFQDIFGKTWNELPIIMKRHYANHPYSNDVAKVEGVMNVESSRIGRFLAPFFKWSGTLVPYEGRDIPSSVKFSSCMDTNGFYFNRIFYFSNQKPYEFKSVMFPISGNEMIEVMRFGLCWRTAFVWTGHKVVLEHRGYGIYLWGKYIPIPLAILIGKGYADETPIDDDTFSMRMYIRHPIWGSVFGYNGIFKIVEDVQR
jgi:hypothetical protein